MVEVKSYTRPIFQAVKVALNQEYPEMAKLTGQDRASLLFETEAGIQNARRDSVGRSPSVVSSSVVGILSKFAIPATEFIKWRDQSFPEKGHSDYLKPEFYLPRVLSEGLSHGNSNVRSAVASRLGTVLIEQAITAVPYKTPYEFAPEWDFLWGYMLKKEIDDFFHPLEKYLGGQKGRKRFRETVKEFEGSLSINGENRFGGVFKAVGAKVLYLLPGQSLAFPERVLGAEFDKATVRILAAPVRSRFIRLVEKYSEGQIQARDDVENNGYNLKLEEAMAVYKALGLSGKKISSGYFNSQIALDYMRTNRPVVDPFNYPTRFADS